MARHNISTYYGRVSDTPRIVKSPSGEFKQGMCYITTLRNDRDINADANLVRYDQPLILTGIPQLAQQMSELKKNDIVCIKGSFTTKNITKKTICKHCGATNTQNGVLDLISPIFIDVCYSDISEEESVEILKGYKEVSNQVLLIGNITKDITLYHPEENYASAQYQLAVGRKYFLKDDSVEVKADYPFIKTFGEQALKDNMYLKTGSSVLVDGYVQTNNYVKKTICSECNQEYNWNDQSMCVVAYAIEYLKNYRTQEEIDEIEQAAYEKEQAEIQAVKNKL